MLDSNFKPGAENRNIKSCLVSHCPTKLQKPSQKATNLKKIVGKSLEIVLKLASLHGKTKKCLTYPLWSLSVTVESEEGY